ncbi:MAG: hypothetical protein MJA29_10840, partial [Candidatus Omnitrophica bacterium]|nr:hypothetical protein [Candidatus Omnitrophota bacterium]
MALIYRNVVGPIKDASGNAVSSGAVRAKLSAPVTDGTDFVTTEEVEAVVSSGAFTLPLGAPGTYTFSVADSFGTVIDTFSAYLASSPTSDITLAE